MTEGPTKLADEFIRQARAEREVAKLSGPATLEERRALRDSGRDERANAMQLALQVVKIRTAALNRACAFVAARCEGEDDARARIRINEQERSRRRMPLYTVILDGVHAWQGGFEQSVAEPGSVYWQERWLTWPSADLPQHQRWMAEPRKSILARDEGGFCATIVRQFDGDARVIDAVGDDEEAAVTALYAKMDAETQASEVRQ